MSSVDEGRVGDQEVVDHHGQGGQAAQGIEAPQAAAHACTLPAYRRVPTQHSFETVKRGVYCPYLDLEGARASPPPQGLCDEAADRHPQQPSQCVAGNARVPEGA
jgi:hypothetical protein